MKTDENKRVLVVCQHFFPESFRINDICASLAAVNIQVDVLCGIPSYPKGAFFKGYNYFYPRTEDHLGIHIMRVGEIPQWKKGGSFFIALNYFYFPLAALFNLFRLLFRGKYDRVFLYGLTPVFMAFPGIVYSKLRKIKSVLYILDYWPDSLYSVIPLKNGFLQWIMKKISFWHYRNADKVLTVSNGMLKKVREEAGVPDRSSYFLPQSCESIYENLVYDEDLHKRLGDRFHFVFAGNIGPAQSLDTLVDAVYSLEQSGENLLDYSVILVGDGQARVALEKKIKEASLSHRFIFEGFVTASEVLKYHEIADVLYLSLSKEPLFSIMIPAKVQSYMASGKPILASLNGEGAEVILEANCGFVCESENSEDLAKAMKQMLSSPPDKLKLFGENGKNYYRQKYHNDIFIKKLITFLEL